MRYAAKVQSIKTERNKGFIRSAFVLNSDEIGRRVISGASYTFIGIALRTLITLGSVSILARLLSPADFGYIAMATVITEFAALLGGFGFSNVLVQRRVVNRLQFDTVFWASTLVGVILACGTFTLSFLAAWLFDSPLTGDLLRVLCFTFLLSGLSSVHWAILARKMLFHTEFWIQITAVFTRAIVAVIFAYLEFGVWSLVAGALAGTIVTILSYFFSVPYRPRFRFHANYLASTWKTSGSYFASGFLYYASMNIDLMLIGRHMGANSLGYYQNARSLTDEVRARIAMPLQRVLFPAFSAIQADISHLQNSVIRSGRILAAIIMPIGVGLSAVSEELVPILYGPQWHAMIPVMSMFGLSAALKGSTAIASPLFNSQDRVGLALKYNSVGTLLMVAGVVLTMPYGVEKVAMAVMLASLYTLVSFRVGLKLIGLGNRHVFMILGMPAIASLVMWLAIAGLRIMAAGTEMHPALLLAGFSISGAFVYAVTIHLLSRQYLREFIDLGKRLLVKG
jgi:O-antigen/teichoic acid export membrane protein